MGSTFTVKALLIFVGVVSLAAALRASVPAILEFSVAHLSTALKPPYLYVVLNAIIISIVASSRFHDSKLDFAAPVVKEGIKNPVASEKPGWIPKVRLDSSEILLLEQLSSYHKPKPSRFAHRKSFTVTTQAEGVKAKPKEDETLEATWKMITERRATPTPTPTPLRRHSKKCMNMEPPPPVKLKKDPSLSQDELNRRVETFINKFNQEMRLQRELANFI